MPDLGCIKLYRGNVKSMHVQYEHMLLALKSYHKVQYDHVNAFGSKQRPGIYPNLC